MVDHTFGGSGGEFVRRTISFLVIMGFTALRFYMFPQAPADGPFDPRTQPSFHVAAEVWVDGRWVAIDPLHGLVFHDTSGNLVTFQQVVADPSIIEAAYRDQPLEVHPAVGGGTVSGAYWITPETFANPQGLNWSSLLPVSGAYADIVGATHADLGAIYLPVVAEQPHAVLTIFWLAISGLCGVISGVCFVWQADRRPQPVAVLQLVPETYPDASV